MSVIEKLIYEVINKSAIEIKKIENKNKIHGEIIRPLLSIISNSLIEEFYPFIIFGSIIFILTFIFAFIIMIQIFRK